MTFEVSASEVSDNSSIQPVDVVGSKRSRADERIVSIADTSTPADPPAVDSSIAAAADFHYHTGAYMDIFNPAYVRAFITFYYRCDVYSHRLTSVLNCLNRSDIQTSTSV